MMPNPDTWSCKRIARTAGALDLLSTFPDGLSVSVLSKVFVRNDAAATAANILASETLFRTGMVAELCALAIFCTSMLLMYSLFKPAGRRAALLFVVFTIVGAAIQSLDVLGDVGALSFLKGGGGVAALTTAQAQSMAYVSLRMHSFAYTVALVFIGFGALCLGYVITRATFLPRVLGYLVMIEGLGYLIGSFATLLSPTLAVQLRPFIPFLTAALGELPLVLWLIVKGVDPIRWQEHVKEVPLTA